jgi:hypothetical protein
MSAQTDWSVALAGVQTNSSYGVAHGSHCKRWLSRLCGSLQVDISKTQAVFGWTPSVGADTALSRTAQDSLAKQAN